MFDFALRRARFFDRFIVSEFFARRRGRFTDRVENGKFRFFLFPAAHTIKPYNSFRNLTRKGELFVDSRYGKIHR